MTRVAAAPPVARGSSDSTNPTRLPHAPTRRMLVGAATRPGGVGGTYDRAVARAPHVHTRVVLYQPGATGVPGSYLAVGVGRQGERVAARQWRC
jgi:hypothetical protein